MRHKSTSGYPLWLTNVTVIELPEIAWKQTEICKHRRSRVGEQILCSVQAISGGKEKETGSDAMQWLKKVTELQNQRTPQLSSITYIHEVFQDLWLSKTRDKTLHSIAEEYYVKRWFIVAWLKLWLFKRVDRNSTNTCIHAFSFLPAEIRCQSSNAELMLPIIPIAIVMCVSVGIP